ncbi:MAG: tripartite tricarboxylate transporter TctB family protein [Oscillibacter sp.]|nr:tripartite tricarboxylate transporter TctB family protein [Oscillibacter sp.]
MKKKFVMNQDRIFSICILIFSIFMVYQTSKIKALFGNVGGSDPGSKLFPYILCIIMGISAVGKFIRSNEPDTKPFFGGHRMRLRVACILIAVGVYSIAFKWIGFLPATFMELAILVLLMKRNHHLKWYRVVLFSAAVTAVIYVVFHNIMKIYLPGGELWKLF